MPLSPKTDINPVCTTTRVNRMAFNVSERENGVVILTMSGPNKNSLNTADLLQLAGLVTECGKRPGIRVLIITGANGNFCHGRVGAKGLTSASAVAEDLDAILKVNAALNALDVPVITAVEGETFGFGFGLVAQSDYSVAAESAVFALPEMSHGLPPLIVFSYLFRFVPFKQAVELSLTSREISAAEAKAAGVVTDVVATGESLNRAIDLGGRIAAMDRKSLSLFRKFSRHVAGAHSPQLSEYAVSVMSIMLAERAHKS